MFEMRDAVGELAGGISEAQGARLREYAALVRELGKRWNLMSRSALGVVEEHMVDCSAALRLCGGRGLTVADLGSGAGLPGIVLAILRPDWSVSLVDSRRSKVVFLREAILRLGLTNASVVHNRIEALEGSGFDLATSRALGPVMDTLEAGLRVVRSGGHLILYKGPRWGDERVQVAAVVAGAGGRIAAEKEVALPGLDRTTMLVSIERTG